MFVDRSLGKFAVAGSLRSAGYPIACHDDHFKDDTPDDEWLALVGEKQWVALSADKNIRHKADLLEAVIAHKVRIVFLTSGQLSGVAQSALFSRCGRRIQDTLMSGHPPVAYGLTKDGKLSKLSLARYSVSSRKRHGR
jgi:hypothetical protein